MGAVYLLFAEVNSRILNGMEGFILHIVLVYSIDSWGNYIIVDPGLGNASPNRVIERNLFLNALGDKGANGEVSGFKV